MAQTAAVATYGGRKVVVTVLGALTGFAIALLLQQAGAFPLDRVAAFGLPAVVAGASLVTTGVALILLVIIVVLVIRTQRTLIEVTTSTTVTEGSGGEGGPGGGGSPLDAIGGGAEPSDDDFPPGAMQ